MLKKYIHISFRFIKLELNKKSPGDSISNLGDGEGSFDDGLLPPVMIHFFNEMRSSLNLFYDCVERLNDCEFPKPLIYLEMISDIEF